MRHVAVLLLLVLSAAAASIEPIRLRDLEVLTLRADEYTMRRRNANVPRLVCTGAVGCADAAPTVAQCSNRGGGDDVQWQCEAEMPTEVRFDRIEVVCEGYRDPDDARVDPRSCALEYSLRRVATSPPPPPPTPPPPPMRERNVYRAQEDNTTGINILLFVVVCLCVAIFVAAYICATSYAPSYAYTPPPPPPSYAPGYGYPQPPAQHHYYTRSSGGGGNDGFFTGMLVGDALASSRRCAPPPVIVASSRSRDSDRGWSGGGFGSVFKSVSNGFGGGSTSVSKGFGGTRRI